MPIMRNLSSASSFVARDFALRESPRFHAFARSRALHADGHGSAEVALFRGFSPPI
jgi:hypothetical protein